MRINKIKKDKDLCCNHSPEKQEMTEELFNDFFGAYEV